MKRNAWLLSAAAVAALSSNALLAQAPIASPAPVMTSAPVINVSDPVYYGGDGGGSGGGMHLLADVGFMVLTPKFTQNPALFLNTDFETDGPQLNHEVDFSYHSQFVPQFSIGVASAGGLGVRMNWWGLGIGTSVAAKAGPTFDIYAASPLQVSQTTFEFFGAENPETMVANTYLHMDVWDLEAVDEFGSGSWAFIGSAGVRYAHIAESYNVAVFEADGTFDEAIVSGHNFNGAGPTVSLEARRELGGSGLYVYSKARGSVLYGTTHQAAVLFFAGDTTVTAFNDSHIDSLVSEGELELGAGFTRDTRFGGLNIQAGFVGQIWSGVGNGSQSAGPTGNGEDIPAQSSLDRNSALGLLGFTLRAGLSY